MTGLRIALLAFLVACPGKNKTPPTTGEKLPPKRVVIGWGFQNTSSLTEIFLATTDETGKQVSHSVGTYKGSCGKIVPAAEMKAVTGTRCEDGTTITELHAVVQDGSQILVLRMTMQQGSTPDPMAREQVTQVGFPLGAAVEVAPD
jgi:hypothetical protein